MERLPKKRPESPRTFEATGKIKLTTQDHKFLRALKIAVTKKPGKLKPLGDARRSE
jgi:hypothetical protein